MGKRMAVLADLHCGHLVGLTPPRWQVTPTKSDGRTKRDKYAEIQKEAWAWYLKNITSRGPFDVIVVNGDAIDGKGARSGGTELITSDRHEQVQMAAQAILRAPKAKGCKTILTYGTAYHTGDGEDFENALADEVNATKIGSHEWVDMGGVVFDFKHHVGGSQIPHGRSTAINREALWSAIWAETDYTPTSNVVIRSHVHYFTFAGGDIEPALRITTPALQAMGTKFGSRRCSGTVSFGFLTFTVDKGVMTWEPVLGKLKTQKATAIKV